jgi:hypothetical protein
MTDQAIDHRPTGPLSRSCGTRCLSVRRRREGCWFPGCDRPVSWCEATTSPPGNGASCSFRVSQRSTIHNTSGESREAQWSTLGSYTSTENGSLPSRTRRCPSSTPATEEEIVSIAMGGPDDVDAAAAVAAAAAAAAFETYSQASSEERPPWPPDARGGAAERHPVHRGPRR